MNLRHIAALTITIIATLCFLAWIAASAGTNDTNTSGTITLTTEQLADLGGFTSWTTNIAPLKTIEPILNISFSGGSSETWMEVNPINKSVPYYHAYSWTNLEVRARYRPVIQRRDTNGWWIIRFEDPDKPDLIKVPRRPSVPSVP